MKNEFLKIAGVKSEKEFYNKYPTETAFFNAHPEALKLKMGGNTPCYECGGTKYSKGGAVDLREFMDMEWFDRSNYATGGSINLDPAKKGTFKAQATRMGMSVQEAANAILNAPEGKYSPEMRRKANFAKNFAKEEGGEMMKSGGNVPTNPSLWSKAKSAAKAKYDVYPSAYANGFAAKWYKQRGGGWKKGKYGMEIMEEGGDPDGEMALGQIMSMHDRLSNLEKFIKPESDLEPWVNSKITLADDYLNSVSDYMQYGENEEGEEEEEYTEMSESEMEEMKNGGIPQRYKNKGFTKVGVKRQSTRPGKKWMVLAKKGDQYKVVHGGYKGMKDFSQHGSEKRKDNFWSRMGGKSSSKATDPFSPLYWHKRFGTWAEGGEPQEPQNKGFQSLPEAVKQKIMSNMAYGGDMFELPMMQFAGDYITRNPWYPSATPIKADVTYGSGQSLTGSAPVSGQVFNPNIKADVYQGQSNLTPPLPMSGTPFSGTMAADVTYGPATTNFTGSSPVSASAQPFTAQPFTKEELAAANSATSVGTPSISSGPTNETTMNANKTSNQRSGTYYTYPTAKRQLMGDRTYKTATELATMPFWNPALSTLPNTGLVGMLKAGVGALSAISGLGTGLDNVVRGFKGRKQPGVTDYAKPEMMQESPVSEMRREQQSPLAPPPKPNIPDMLPRTEYENTAAYGGTMYKAQLGLDYNGMSRLLGANAGLGMFNDVVGYNQQMKQLRNNQIQQGMTDSAFVPQTQGWLPMGYDVLNTGPGQTQAPNLYTPMQYSGSQMPSRFSEGGEYDLTPEEISYIIAMGGEIEFL